MSSSNPGKAVIGRIPLDDTDGLKMAYVFGVIDNGEEIKQRHILSRSKAEMELVKAAQPVWTVDKKTGSHTLTVKSEAGKYRFAAQVTWSAIDWAATDDCVMVAGTAQGMGGQTTDATGKAVIAAYPTVKIIGRRMGEGTVRLDAEDIPAFYLICQE